MDLQLRGKVALVTGSTAGIGFAIAQVLVRDAQHVYLGTTFGLVLTQDGGATWRYVCEPYVTGSLSSVALYALTARGSVIGLSDHLRRSADFWSATARAKISSGRIQRAKIIRCLLWARARQTLFIFTGSRLALRLERTIFHLL